jgi:CheY-like chemotaxis protein
MAPPLSIPGKFAVTSEHYRNRPRSNPPQLKRVLVVDDNKFYAEALTKDVQARGATDVLRAEDAEEGIRMLGERCEGFDGIITDITMETQLSGLRVIRHANRCGFPGVLAVATTGIDNAVGLAFNTMIFGHVYKTDYMIPKKPVQDHGDVMWIETPARGRRVAGSVGAQ